MNLLLVES